MTGDDEPAAQATPGVATTRSLMVNAEVLRPSEKRSITIAGHPTSIRVESLFWDALLADSRRLGLPVSALVAQIDAQRLAVDPPPNLASAIRLWLFARATHGVAAKSQPSEK